jgi:hypothetical protein
MSHTVNIPILNKSVVVLIIGIIIGFLLLYFINSNNQSLLKCDNTEKFTLSNNDRIIESMSEIYKTQDNEKFTQEKDVTPQINNMLDIDIPVMDSINNYQDFQEEFQEEFQENDNNIKEMSNTINYPLGFDHSDSLLANVEPTEEIKNNTVKSTQTKCGSHVSIVSDTNSSYPMPMDMHDDYASFNTTIPNVKIPEPVPKREIEKMQNMAAIKMYNFNTSWCGWSKVFQPEWDKFTMNVKSNDSLNGVVEIMDIKCDNDNNTQLCIDHNVEGYPTVVIIKNGVSSHYRGPRTVDGLTAELNKLLNM